VANLRTHQDTSAIELLHQLDIDATLADKADEMVKLWDDRAVRIQPRGEKKKEE
jgi:hypothetical protein